ncbi:hypothetical protein LSH36_683g03072 [Paralvinella palmiformis]|uniref:Uncharacterized protein n=1 Tax=Paralvinella palmiformis TaxID=53620 RepID=A0AAD9J3L5_9ANNE|nr:hypothetical protein LSH36_683g03072 [Paralvinella palmiformis]
MAGVDWTRVFLDRNRDIVLRTPEATSIQRANWFQQSEGAGFMTAASAYSSVTSQGSFPHHKFNLATLYVTNQLKCWQRKARKVFMPLPVLKGAECDSSYSTSATGAFIPPMLIFHFLPEVIDKAPTYTIGRATKSGWIISEIFNE